MRISVRDTQKIDKASVRNVRDVYNFGQSHIFRWWNEISQQEKNNLLKQLSTIDFQVLNRLFKNRFQKTVKIVAGSMVSPHVIKQPSTDAEKEMELEAKRIGEAAIESGEIAILTVAGGDGTRLGISCPKGTLPITPISKKSIFQLYAEKIRAIQQKYRVVLPWYIMTSETNNVATQRFFQSNQFFGLDHSMVLFFPQKMLPVVDFNGRLMMDSKSRIIMSPNGHGGVISALNEKGLLADMKRRGVNNIFYHQIDNVLIKMADPVFVGYHLREGAEISLKIVKKQSQEEKVGVVVSCNGHLQVIEYSELSSEDMHAKNEDGTLKFSAGNIAVHMINIDFLGKICQKRNPLPYHVAIKKMSYLDEKGNVIVPAENNAIKYECFIFDIFKHVKKWAVMEVLREEEFSPVKNVHGDYSQTTAERDMINLFGRWLHKAGIPVPVDSQGNVIGLIEISPVFALDQNEFIHKIDKNMQFHGSLYL